MKKLFFFFSVFVLAGACNKAGTGVETTSPDTSGYTLEDIPGSDVRRAVKKDADGNTIEEGFFKNGLKTGTWVTYEPENSFPVKIISYVDGQYNGPYFEFNTRGQVQLRASYLNNKLHGDWGQYRFGRPEKTASYKNGELHGTYKEYFSRDGKLQKEINYKDGKQHGVYRYYNEAGEVTLEYEFENGEQVSGGIVNPDKPNDPK